MSASATLSLDFGFVKEYTQTLNYSTIELSPNFILGLVAGYNARDWNANVSWVSNRTALTGEYAKGGYNINTGNYRLTVAKRFTTKGKLRGFLNKIDKMLDKYL